MSFFEFNQRNAIFKFIRLFKIQIYYLIGCLSYVYTRPIINKQVPFDVGRNENIENQCVKVLSKSSSSLESSQLIISNIYHNKI